MSRFWLILSLLLVARFSVGGDFPMADRVIVEKAERKLYLMKDGDILRSFDIALGLVPKGDKEREGDQKTPEGVYTLDARNPDSDFFLSIHVSYPNATDRREARSKGVKPRWSDHGSRAAEQPDLL